MLPTPNEIKVPIEVNYFIRREDDTCVPKVVAIHNSKWSKIYFSCVFHEFDLIVTPHSYVWFGLLYAPPFCRLWRSCDGDDGWYETEPDRRSYSHALYPAVVFYVQSFTASYPLGSLTCITYAWSVNYRARAPSYKVEKNSQQHFIGYVCLNDDDGDTGQKPIRMSTPDTFYRSFNVIPYTFVLYRVCRWRWLWW